MTDADSKPILEAEPNVVKKCRHGTMIYNRYDQYVGRSLQEYGEYNEAESDFLCSLISEGDSIIEIGANMGSHSVALAKAVGPQGSFCAFEPQEVLFQLLCANMVLNGLTHASCYNMALGNTDGALLVPPLDYNAENNFGALSLGTHQSGRPVLLKRLDDIAASWASCRLLKIDVEGMELEVLRGAEGFIGKLQPLLYLENDRKEKSPPLLDFLFEHGYTPFWHLPKLFNPNNFYGNPEYVFDRENLASINLFCAPPGLVIEGMDEWKVLSRDDWWRDLRERMTGAPIEKP